MFPATPASPAFLHSGSGHATPITHPAFTAKLRKVLSQADSPASKFSGDSFRRGGTTFAFRCGAPVELISLQGDWSSDAVLLYIAHPLERRISVASMIARNMPEHTPHTYPRLIPLPFFYDFFLSFSLFGGLGEPHQGGGFQFCLPLVAALLFPANNKVSIIVYSRCYLMFPYYSLPC